MFDDLMWKLFPAGGDIVASVTQLVLWVGALFFLAGAILVGSINFASRRAKFVPVLARSNSPAKPRAANRAR